MVGLGEHTVKCNVCFKKFFAHSEGHGKTQRTFFTYSEEGVCSLDNNWFCNDCWRDILKDIDIKKIIKELRAKNGGV